MVGKWKHRGGKDMVLFTPESSALNPEEASAFLLRFISFSLLNNY